MTTVLIIQALSTFISGASSIYAWLTSVDFTFSISLSLILKPD